METNEQREERVIKRTIDNYVEKYRRSKTKQEKEDIDYEVIECLRMLVPEKVLNYWEYYKSKR